MEGKKGTKSWTFPEQTSVTGETTGNSLARKLFQKTEKPEVGESEDQKAVGLMAGFLSGKHHVFQRL